MVIRKDITTRSLADGTLLRIPVFHFPGKDATAPSAYVQSSVHAAEVQGYMVALQLIEHFAKKPPAGDVTIVPHANPYGISCKMGWYTSGRFDPVTGDNWNRNYIDFSALARDFVERHPKTSFKALVSMFKAQVRRNLASMLVPARNYAEKLAIELQEMAFSADIVLDLHCDTLSVPHIYSPKYALSSTPAIGIPFVLAMDNHKFGGSLDEAIFCPWAAFTDTYNALHPQSTEDPPVESFTVELGHQEFVNIAEAQKHTAGILHYLGTKGLCERSAAPVFSGFWCKKEDFYTIYAPVGGIIIDSILLGQPTEADTPLMVLNAPHLFDKVTKHIDFVQESSRIITLGEDIIPLTQSVSPIVHEGMAIMKVMKRYEKYS